MTNKDSLWLAVSSEIEMLRENHIPKTHCLNKCITLVGLPVRRFRSDTNRHIHAEMKAHVLWVSEQTEGAYVWFVQSAFVLSDVLDDCS